METKICTKCEKNISINNFGKSKRNKDGIKTWCRNCESENMAAWRLKHKKPKKPLQTKEERLQYLRSSKYKISNRIAVKKYQKSEKGIENRIKYRKEYKKTGWGLFRNKLRE
jgi:hypothetical protein